MNRTLNIIDGSQVEPSEIPDFCVVEFYQDSISVDKSLGYSIIPIEGLTNDEVVAAITEKANTIIPSGYTNFIVLSGHTEPNFNHKRVYGVWYQGETVPAYPAEPEVTELVCEKPFDIYKHIILMNNGSKKVSLSITFTLSSFGEDIEMFINDEFYTITPSVHSNTYVLDNNGVTCNGDKISTFNFNTLPFLSVGENEIKIKRTNISNISFDYKEEY